MKNFTKSFSTIVAVSAILESSSTINYFAGVRRKMHSGILSGPEAWTSAAQDVPINEKGGTYIVSGWAKANAIGSTGTDYGSSKPNMRHNSQTMCR
mgnify:CR=1 FL=1|jgi:hypothetical protein